VSESRTNTDPHDPRKESDALFDPNNTRGGSCLPFHVFSCPLLLPSWISWTRNEILPHVERAINTYLTQSHSIFKAVTWQARLTRLSAFLLENPRAFPFRPLRATRRLPQAAVRDAVRPARGVRHGRAALSACSGNWWLGENEQRSGTRLPHYPHILLTGLSKITIRLG
jgi:hypothetical protein